MSLPLIVFDLDGTLVDSRLDLAASANALLEEYGSAPLGVDAVAAMVGDGARVLVTRVLEAAGRADVDVQAALNRFLALYDQHLVDHTRLYPGVVETLGALAGRATVTMLTNKPGHHTERLLAALGIRHHFATVIGGDAAFPRKPDPTALLHLVGTARATPETTVMVGDSIVDVETAERAATRLCVARYGFGRLPADVTFAPGTLEAHVSTDLATLLIAFVARA